MDALTWATWGLVLATVSLVVVTIFIGWRTVGESRAARETATEQARLAKETLDVSRRTLAEAEMQRALGSPFELEIALEESVAGSAIIVLRNYVGDTVMRLQRLELIRVPSGPVLVDESLAEGTLGTGEMWRRPVSWDADANRGATFELPLTGHRIGAPTMTQINAYRVDGDGVLHDLAEVVTLAAYGK